MTGEITLRGKVLPVGGVKEKVIAAKSAGIKRVILPTKNEKDLEDVSEPVRQALRFEFVDDIEDVLDLAFGDALKQRPLPESNAAESDERTGEGQKTPSVAVVANVEADDGPGEGPVIRQ